MNWRCKYFFYIENINIIEYQHNGFNRSTKPILLRWNKPFKGYFHFMFYAIPVLLRFYLIEKYLLPFFVFRNTLEVS